MLGFYWASYKVDGVGGSTLVAVGLCLCVLLFDLVILNHSNNNDGGFAFVLVTTYPV